ncbi:MAG: glucose-1-phosphate adenylyltransferase [Omnitrophica WOR_2 bacterium GWF2_43_52]|nr:MAG: glucose-1-phosphate adenylyltransferase [Omnitrophica WOR_2 bacterium GWA2_44_7]OGX15549.1 MAG: glucose-1-phosphate adenylyltransferase [Omnitrophica WOR_2 bacterium GWC2_44_8]OGX20206.1 MAG: glucose-1-phosphate adenylyltransferase [Omnitrophica WOR_2 bacterium GWF2_43_52]OGX53140.1 MAG: glucose-1-phosphate adenylyltransferase [Omnitrophica WOR_2 bacterium RIFOXYC2_FULL_43_9]
MMRKVFTFVLAGGKGERLYPLTKDRAKPAVPFGGIYRIIDFTLSNCINSGLRRIHVLIQYKSISLQRHLRVGWNIFNSDLGEFIDVIPAQQRVGSDWYRGTADAIYQNIYTIEQEKPDEILILAGDHVYKMNYYKMIDFHRESEADLTVSVVEMEKERSVQLGVLEVDAKGGVLGFEEKPVKPETIPGKPDKIYASMGIYVFSRQALEEELTEDASRNTDHDFGRNIIPQMVRKGKKICAYNFSTQKSEDGAALDPDATYWRDIGTIDGYYQANVDLLGPEPVFNLYDQNFPIRTYQEQFPPARTIHSDEEAGRVGQLLDSLVSSGCVISGGKVQRSILSPNVRINSFSEVYDSILMEGVDVGRYAKIQRAIIDKEVKIPRGMIIGYDAAEDKKRFTVTESGIVVVGKGTEIK